MGTHLIIPGGTRVIDATGKYVMPGGIDANVHFETPYAKVHILYINIKCPGMNNICFLVAKVMD